MLTAGDQSALSKQLRGELLQPGSTGYDDQVRGYNTAVTHTPDLVVRAAAATDVQQAMRYAAEAGLAVGVQATGHGATVPMTEGLLITTGGLDTLEIDPASRTARIGAGVRWRQVIDAAAPHGLAPLNGSSSDVGAVGFTLGGGLPVMGRTFGFAADRVRSLEVVTPDGQLRSVDPDHDADLFWGLRGSQSNLGIVTSMEMELVEVRSFYGGGLFYAAQHIPAVLHAYRQWCQGLPEAITTSVAILRLPPAPEVPEVLRGAPVAHVRVCSLAGAAATERMLSPLRTAAPAVLDAIGELPYEQIDSVHRDPENPIPTCHRGLLLRALTAETVEAVLEVAGPQVQTPLVICEIRQMGGALARYDRAGAAGNAVSGRDAAFWALAIGLVTPETAASAPAAADAVAAAVKPWGTGTTIMTMHGSPGDEVDRARAWDQPTYERLVRLVKRTDPAGLLRFGHAVGRPVGAR